MREEILACDKELIKRAKKAGAIGGKKIIEICQWTSNWYKYIMMIESTVLVWNQPIKFC